MNNNKLNIDEYTKKLVQLSEKEEPSKDFTKGVMNKILLNPEVKVNFITKDDKNSNIWLVISILTMVIGYSVFSFIKGGFTFDGNSSYEVPGYLQTFIKFFSSLFQELSFSPYIFIALLGVVLLVLMDKTIIRFLYSI